ncbi:MAG TPA: hypothetical protein VLA45_12605, partial [Paracoccaceae bacterium]|nr:hypothetical protein [Paracoccaceae bacterium]
RQPARAVLAVMLAYIGVNAGITHARETAAVGQGEVVIASPPPFFFWQRQMITGGNGRYMVDGEPVGDFDLTEADKPQISAAVSEAAPLLYWSRVPLVHVADDGRYLLTDARYLGRESGSFTIELPAEVCAPQDPPTP